MSSEEAPDFEVVLAELVSRPAWHRQAACKGSGPGGVLPGAWSVIGRRQGRLRRLVRSVSSASLMLWPTATGTGIWGGMSERGRRVLRRAAA